MKLWRRRNAAILVVFLAGCTSPGLSDALPPPQTPNPRFVVSPAVCPKPLPSRAPRQSLPGITKDLVPLVPAALVLCSGGSRFVVKGTPLQQLVATLQTLRKVPKKPTYICPANLGPVYVLYFDYVQGFTLPVTVRSSGCAFTSNGALSAYSNKRELARITALLRQCGSR